MVNAHPAVAESAAFPVRSEFGDQEAMVAVVLEEGASPTQAEVRAVCAEALPDYAVPRYIEFVDALPKTQTQKVQRGALSERGITAATWDAESVPA